VECLDTLHGRIMYTTQVLYQRRYIIERSVLPRVFLERPPSMSEEDRSIRSRASELSSRAEMLKNKYGGLLRDLQRLTEDTSNLTELRALLDALSAVESRASHSAAQSEIR
jgi:hypothetical protein